MKQRQFLCIDLLNTFSEKELEGLKDIVTCKYFNTDRYISGLLRSLNKHVLGKNAFIPKLQVKVYSEIFPDLPAPKNGLEKKQRSHLNAKMSILTRLAEQFLVTENINNNELQKNELLYDSLLKRRQVRLFEKHMKGDNQTLDEQQKIDELYHYRRYTIERKEMDYLHQTGRLVTEDNLPKIVSELDTYYLLNKLSLYSTALSLQHVSSKKQYNRDEFKAGTDELMNQPRYAQHPIAQLFAACITLLETSDNEAYVKLLVLLDEHADIVPIYLLKSFYGTANVYCVGQIIFGHIEYQKKMFDLNKIMHDKNLFVEDNFIQIGQIKNMVTVACRVEEYNWAEEILEYYKRYIRGEIRDSVYHFNLGTIAFYKKDYDIAYDKFIQVDKINTVYDINTRMLIVKCLYEKETEYSEYTMQTFRSTERFFKDRTSLTTKSKKGYKNFILILIALYRICHNINAKPKDIERIKNKLNDQKVNSDKRWLLEKIEELRGER